MSISHRTYLIYGVHVPESQFKAADVIGESGRVDDVLGSRELEVVGISHLVAGAFGGGSLFLVMDAAPGKSGEVPLGSYRHANAEINAIRLERLSDRLEHAVKLLGYDSWQLEPPDWIVVPDES